MAAYLTLAAFKVRSLMPQTDVEALEALAPGFVDGQLEYYSRWIDARLRKRYAAPFETPNETVKEWLSRLVTVRCYLRRGVDPTDEQFVSIKEDRDEARDEIKEAADSETGLFDLPLLDAADGTAVSKGGPYGYSEQSPYVAFDRQAETGRTEDRNRTGTES